MSDAVEGMDVAAGSEVADWAEIEAQYCAGFMSIREIGRQHGMTHLKIIRRAAKLEWTRNIPQEILEAQTARRRDSKYQNHLTNMKNMRLERMLFVAASIKAEIRVAHREDWAALRELHNHLFEELAQFSFLAEPNSATLAGRIELLKRMTETYERIVGGERAAFGIEGEPAAPPPDAAEQMPVLELARRLAFILQKGIEQAQIEKPVDKKEAESG